VRGTVRASAGHQLVLFHLNFSMHLSRSLPHHPPSRSAADLYMQHISTLVAPACSALALAAGADTLWRSLNHALLMLVAQSFFKRPKSVLLTRFSYSLAMRLLSCASEHWPASTPWSTACGRRCANHFFRLFFLLFFLFCPAFSCAPFVTPLAPLRSTWFWRRRLRPSCTRLKKMTTRCAAQIAAASASFLIHSSSSRLLKPSPSASSRIWRPCWGRACRTTRREGRGRSKYFLRESIRSFLIFKKMHMQHSR
jgi:hypothetical protein